MQKKRWREIWACLAKLPKELDSGLEAASTAPFPPAQLPTGFLPPELPQHKPSVSPGALGPLTKGQVYWEGFRMTPVHQEQTSLVYEIHLNYANASLSQTRRICI